MSSPFNPWVADAADGREDMTNFSKDLLRALHREHPRILGHLASQGKMVATP